MQARILRMQPVRHGRRTLAWAGAVALLVLLVLVVWRSGGPAPADQASPQPDAPAARPAVQAPAPAPSLAATAATPAAPPAGPVQSPCPIQSLHIAEDGGMPRTVCMDATLLQQNGSVRSYLVRAGDTEGWLLRIDTVERALHRVALQARDGRHHACEAGGCGGRLEAGERLVGGVATLALHGLRLTGPAGTLVVDGRLRIPPDEQVPGLACGSAAVTLTGADGALRRFCGQGGAGMEIADDGTRRYHFQDHEGRSLRIEVDAAQRVVGLDWPGAACRGEGCRGARMVAATATNGDPAADALAERSFFFGRTVLADAQGRPVVVIDGSLVLPAQ